MNRRTRIARFAQVLAHVAILALVAPSAWAQRSIASSALVIENDRASIAASHHRAAVAAFASGHYREAIARWLEANAIRPSVAISFNIARAHERLDQVSDALAWYRDYLDRAKQPSDRASVTRRVQHLEDRLSRDRARSFDLVLNPSVAELAARELSALPVAAPVPPPVAPMVPAPPVAAARARDAPSEGHVSEVTIVGVVALGLGAAALGGALAFEVMRSDAEDDAKHETTQVRFADDIDTMRSRQVIARVLLGVGVGLLGTGGGLVLVGATRQNERAGARLALSCPLPNCGASVTGRF